MNKKAEALLAILADAGRDAFLDACFGREVEAVEGHRDREHGMRSPIVVTFRTPSRRFKTTVYRMASHSHRTRDTLRVGLCLRHYPVGCTWEDGDGGDEQLLDAFRRALLDAAFRRGT